MQEIELQKEKIPKPNNREAWLLEACKQLKPWVEDCFEAALFELPLVSVGFPKGGRSGKGSNTVGQCWSKRVSGDKERSHIFIIPTLTDPLQVLHILLHELVHASVGTECGHRREFRKVAVQLGLKPPMTATTPNENLTAALELLNERLGAYPHPGLTVAKYGSVGSRSLKVECPACGCIVRMTRKWLNEVGPPRCGCGPTWMREA